MDCRGDFIRADVYDCDAKDCFDIVICQAVLRHLDSPENFLKKMIEFAKTGAYIICIDSNREFECDGLYIDGMDYFRLCEHEGMEKHWRAELEQQGAKRKLYSISFDAWNDPKRGDSIL